MYLYNFIFYKTLHNNINAACLLLGFKITTAEPTSGDEEDESCSEYVNRGYIVPNNDDEPGENNFLCPPKSPCHVLSDRDREALRYQYVTLIYI